MHVFRKKMPNGTESPTYYVRAQVNGRKILQTTGCTQKREAERTATALLSKLRKQSSVEGLVANFRDELAGGRVVKLADAFGLFLQKPRSEAASDKQLASKKVWWDDFLRFLGDKYPSAARMSDVTVEMAEAYIMAIRQAGRYDKAIAFARRGKISSYTRKGNALSNSSLNHAHSHLNQVFKVLHRDAGMIENPFAHIPKLPNDWAARDAFTTAELALIGQNPDPFLHPIFLIGLYTGLREGDICTLKWSEVDVDLRWITRVMRKTKKAVRVPVLPPLREFLRQLPRTGEWILPDHARMYQTNPSGISYRVSKYLNGLGIETQKSVPGRSCRVTSKDVHSLRHTFCYQAAIHNVPFAIVQSIVGHVDAKVTQMYMQHADDATKEKMLACMPDYLGKQVAPALTVQARVVPPAQVAVGILKTATAATWREVIAQAIAELESSYQDERPVRAG